MFEWSYELIVTDRTEPEHKNQMFEFMLDAGMIIVKDVFSSLPDKGWVETILFIPGRLFDASENHANFVERFKKFKLNLQETE